MRRADTKNEKTTQNNEILHTFGFACSTVAHHSPGSASHYTFVCWKLSCCCGKEHLYTFLYTRRRGYITRRRCPAIRVHFSFLSVHTSAATRKTHFFCSCRVLWSRDYSTNQESMAFGSRRVGCGFGVTLQNEDGHDDDYREPHTYDVYMNDFWSFSRSNTKIQIIIRHFGHDAAKTTPKIPSTRTCIA